MGLTVAARAEETLTPRPVGVDRGDPMILAPGMGWVAYCWIEDLWRNPVPQLQYLIQGLRDGKCWSTSTDRPDISCRLVYLRMTWRQFEEWKTTYITPFLEMIEALNAAEPEALRHVKVFLCVVFFDSCTTEFRGYPDGRGVDQFPPFITDPCSCVDCPRSADIQGTHLLDYCANPSWSACLDRTGQAPYYAKYQIRELNYFNPQTLPAVVSPWNQELVDFASAHDCVAGIHAGFMGDYGQNHVAMFTAYGQAEGARSWAAYRDNLRSWIADLRQRVQSLPRGVDLFFSENAHWQHADFEGHLAGVLPPEVSIVEDLFSLAREEGLTLHWGQGPIPLSPDPSYALAFRESIRESVPFFDEWDGFNETLEDDFALCPNYMQLNMCGLPKAYRLGCWGLTDAILSFDAATFQDTKNRLGYRFQAARIQRELRDDGGYVRLAVRNIGDGFCVNPVRLTLWGQQDDSPPLVGDQQVLSPGEIRELRQGDWDELEVLFPLPAPSSSSDALTWRVGLEVYDAWSSAWLPVNWSNRGFAGLSNQLTVVPRVGDVNDDLQVNEADADLLRGVLVEGRPQTIWDPRGPDLNADGVVDVRDLVQLQLRLTPPK